MGHVWCYGTDSKYRRVEETEYLTPILRPTENTSFCLDVWSPNILDSDQICYFFSSDFTAVTKEKKVSLAVTPCSLVEIHK